MTTRTYRGKWEGKANDDNAYPCFNAENLDEAVKIANRKWPAKEGEDRFTPDVMQIFTNNGWVWSKDYHE